MTVASPAADPDPDQSCNILQHALPALWRAHAAVMASLRSLARSLDLSPATVSRVLAGRPHVRDQVRVRVLAAAAAAGLASPSAGAGAGRRLLALVGDGWMHGPSVATVGELLTGASQGARQAGATLAVQTVDDLRRGGLAAYPAVQRARPSALLLCLWQDAETAADLAAALPTVVVGQPPAEYDGMRYAVFDAADGVLRLLDHLLELGHRRLVFLSSASSGWRGCERAGAAQAAALQRGASLAQLRIGRARDWSLVRRAMRSGTTGWICDAQSTGETLLRLCCDWGIGVPRDVSVCGFFFTAPSPDRCPLTGMHGDWAAVGRIAARWALTRPDRLDPGMRMLVRSRVEPGGTTGPVRNG
jgi:LacI family transcriptional regulator